MIDHVHVTYLSDGTVYVVELPKGPRLGANLVSTWPLPQLHERQNYAGLSCGANGSMLFHGTWLSQSNGQIQVKTELIEANAEARTTRIVPRNTSAKFCFPVLSPSGAFIAGTSYADGKDIVAVLSRSSGAVRLFKYMRSASPHAWGPSDDNLLLTALDESEKGWEVVSLDLRSETFGRVCAGGRPILSQGTGLVAALSSDYQSILVLNPDGSIHLTLRGFFKTIAQWIDASRLLYVTGIGYVDSLGIANVEDGTIQEYSLPSNGEINGACCATIPDA